VLDSLRKINKVVKLLDSLHKQYQVVKLFDSLHKNRLEVVKWRAPKSRGETKLKVSQSQVAESRLGSMLPASNSRKG
jgi:hypothetical protein